MKHDEKITNIDLKKNKILNLFIFSSILYWTLSIHHFLPRFDWSLLFIQKLGMCQQQQNYPTTDTKEESTWTPH